MADTRSVRRAAEKTARDTLAGTMVGAIGELAVALAAREESGSRIAEPRANGDALVDAARREPARLISDAEEGAGQSSKQYNLAWQSARESGRSAPQLRVMGYKPPSPRRKRGEQPSHSLRSTEAVIASSNRRVSPAVIAEDSYSTLHSEPLTSVTTDDGV